jgi:hypothetical protein
MIAAGLFCFAQGQTAAERQALTSLGSGFSLYAWNNCIIKLGFDSSGQVRRTVLYDPGRSGGQAMPHPCLSADGRSIYFRKCPDDTNCQIWRMDTNGANQRLFSQESHPFAAWFRSSWKEPDRLIFSSSVHPYDNIWRHCRVWTMEHDGSASIALNFAYYSTALMDSVYDVITDWDDIWGDLLAYRKDRTYVCVYDMQSGKETRFTHAIGCNPTFRPDGEVLMINRSGHKGYYLYHHERDTVWSMTDSASYELQLATFKWSNVKGWVAMITDQMVPMMAMAHNVVTKSMVRTSFEDSGTIQYASLWLDTAQSSIRHGRDRLSRQMPEVISGHSSLCIPAFSRSAGEVQVISPAGTIAAIRRIKAEDPSPVRIPLSSPGVYLVKITNGDHIIAARRVVR